MRNVTGRVGLSFILWYRELALQANLLTINFTHED